MDKLLSSFKISVQTLINNKNTEFFDLGKRIIENSIVFIDSIGFDAFTFKKSGEKIGSNESSIYHFFLQ